MSDEYVLLIAKESLKPLKERIHSLGGFYNGLGYAFPSEKESIIKQIVSTLPRAKMVKMPLAPGQNFESLRQSYKTIYFRDQLIKLDKEILVKQQEHHLEEFSEEAINTNTISEQNKEFLLDLLNQKESLKNALTWAEGVEKAMLLKNPSLFNIKYVNEKEVNYFLEDAPEVPRLINYLEGSNPKPFIRKGIVGMLVAAGGAGKTHALAQLAIAIVTGSSWLGAYPVEKPGHVFMGLGENSEEDIHRLLRKIVNSLDKRESTFFERNAFKEASGRLAVMSFNGLNASFVRQEMPTAFFEMFLQELKAKQPEEGWSCIILDPISRFLGADAETDNAAATLFISLLERITLELRGNPTILFGHHMNKSGVTSTNTDQASARGSSAITDGVRWQANLEKVKKENKKDGDEEYEINQITLKTVKSNFTVILPAQKLLKDETGCLHAIQLPQVISSKGNKK